jgi:hypothetical protein
MFRLQEKECPGHWNFTIEDSPLQKNVGTLTNEKRGSTYTFGLFQNMTTRSQLIETKN